MAIFLAHRHTTLRALNVPVPKSRPIAKITSNYKATVAVSSEMEADTVLRTYLGTFFKSWINRQQDKEKKKNPLNSKAGIFHSMKPKPQGSYYIPARKNMPKEFTVPYLNPDDKPILRSALSLIQDSHHNWSSKGSANITQNINYLIRYTLYAAYNESFYAKLLDDPKIWPLYYEVAKIIRRDSDCWRPWLDIDHEERQKRVADENAGPLDEQIFESYRAAGAMEIDLNMSRGVTQIWQNMFKLTAIPVPKPGAEDQTEDLLPTSLHKPCVAFFRVSQLRYNSVRDISDLPIS